VAQEDDDEDEIEQERPRKSLTWADEEGELLEEITEVDRWIKRDHREAVLWGCERKCGFQSHSFVEVTAHEQQCTASWS